MLGKTATDLLLMGFTALIFMSALTMALWMNETAQTAVASAFRAGVDQDRNTSMILRAKENDSVSGAEVIQTIYRLKQFDYDVVVDGVHFPRNAETDEIHAEWISPAAAYSVKRERDGEGDLMKIVFTLQASS